MEDHVSWPSSKFLQTAVSIKITLRLQKSRSTQDKIQIAKFSRKWQALVDLQHVVEMLQSSLHLLKLFLSSPTWELNHRFMEESWNPKQNGGRWASRWLVSSICGWRFVGAKVCFMRFVILTYYKILTMTLKNDEKLSNNHSKNKPKLIKCFIICITNTNKISINHNKLKTFLKTKLSKKDKNSKQMNINTKISMTNTFFNINLILKT